MSDNPLQRYFRQPKIYINLPSKGLFNQPGAIEDATGDLPVMSMTGMDEILMKTPDALMNGEATVNVLKSCCPNIKDAWDLSVIDLDLMLIAIRIATYGNNMEVGHTCPSCNAENEYSVDLMRLIDHFSRCKYENKIVLKELTIYIRPLNYRQVTEFNIKNFEMQRQLAQAIEVTDDETKSQIMNSLYEQLAQVQNETYIRSIDNIEVPEGVVDQREYITEWVTNCEKSMFDSIKQQIDKNNQQWRSPPQPVKCAECGADHDINIELDQSNFFV
jgi:hypothetical protein